MNLADTVNLMCSVSYEDRLIAEYHQLRIRIDKLTYWITHVEDNITPEEVNLLRQQREMMSNYLAILQYRLGAKGIDPYFPFENND